MAWFAVYFTTDGTLDSTGEVVASPLPVGKASVALAGPPDFSTQMWDPALRALVPKPAPVPSADQVAANALINTNTTVWTPANLATALQLLLRKFSW